MIIKHAPPLTINKKLKINYIHICYTPTPIGKPSPEPPLPSPPGFFWGFMICWVLPCAGYTSFQIFEPALLYLKFTLSHLPSELLAFHRSYQYSRNFHKPLQWIKSPFSEPNLLPVSGERVGHTSFLHLPPDDPSVSLRCPVGKWAITVDLYFCLKERG